MYGVYCTFIFLTFYFGINLSITKDTKKLFHI